VRIRPEQPADYPHLARIHALAFENRAAEPAVVALRRQSPVFDAELSLVAEVDGAIAGHVLFVPETIRLLDADVRAVNLAPIAIHPARQRRGIGSALIEEGHRIARAKGFVLSFLLGHPEYYGRFGYRGGLYGTSSTRAFPRGNAPLLAPRAPGERDLDGLCSLWLAEEGAVDFSIHPGRDLLGWVSPNPAVEALVWERAGALAGYTRVNRYEPARVRMFLAADDEAAGGLVRGIADRYGLAGGIELPLHPRSRSAPAFVPPRCEPWEAGMAVSLDASPLEEYIALLQASTRMPGRPLWPVVFDLA
jgi:predicted N-acetyltransferase YhbS